MSAVLSAVDAFVEALKIVVTETVPPEPLFILISRNECTEETSGDGMYKQRGSVQIQLASSDNFKWLVHFETPYYTPTSDAAVAVYARAAWMSPARYQPEIWPFATLGVNDIAITLANMATMSPRLKRDFYVNYDGDSRVYTWTYHDEERLNYAEVEADGTVPGLPQDVVDTYNGALPHLLQTRPEAKAAPSARKVIDTSAVAESFRSKLCKFLFKPWR